ncbi:hypothetical protein PARHAE_03229 [Paracoccus haematequi]|uniref:Uncharacterized protein n=1 Tax=Paracoccus haematequi TaxID=2491866 RepID=A0A447IRB0_9RHOB|nr:hypothetical protein [Paracoccus haematequi]VDS10019.1 hypothetical protein PARHAE_03229 [Paracoccus haematequi]
MSGENIAPISHAGGTGADIQDWLSWIDDNIRREVAARNLADAVLDCDPLDRLEMLEQCYDALRPGFPIIAMNSLMVEASFWADRASPAERKAYALACFNRMPARDQAAFLDYVQGRSAA